MTDNFPKPKFSKAEIAELDRAYLTAIYEVYAGDRIIPLKISQCNPQLDLLLSQQGYLTWAFVTAYNPYSQPLSRRENQQRHQRSIQLLQGQNYSYLTGVGRDSEDLWTPELSLLIFDIELKYAIALGREFQQNAIIWGELKQPSQLVWLV